MDRIYPPQTARAVIVLGACSLIVLGFFLPWMEGAGILDLRTFSGFDLASLARNFEISADSGAGVGRVRATALALYLVPALAANATVIECVSLSAPTFRQAGRIAAFLAGTYALLVLAVVLFLSQVPVNGFEAAAGKPSLGFALTGLGGVMVGGIGAFVPVRGIARPV